MGPKLINRARRLLDDWWLARTDPLSYARKYHREARHARRRARVLQAYLPKHGIGAEIGVFWAHFSEVLVREFQPQKLYLVDPWDKLHGETFSWSTEYTLNGTLKTETAMQAACDLERKHPAIVEVHKAFSHEFLPGLPDGSLDWVYLDASHSYKNVKQDLELILPKLKLNGVILGDDYFGGEQGAHKGVRRAVDEFAPAHGLNLVVLRHHQYAMSRNPLPPPDEKSSKR